MSETWVAGRFWYVHCCYRADDSSNCDRLHRDLSDERGGGW